MNKIYIGVDPGASKRKDAGGWIAILDDLGRPLRTSQIKTYEYRLGKTGKARQQVDTIWLKWYLKQASRDHGSASLVTAIEHPPTPSEQFGAPVTFMFGLFIAYGGIKSVIDEVSEWVYPIYPISWRSAYKLKAEKAGGKEASLRLAREMFPSIDLRNKHSHNLAEALLIAEYARLVHINHQPAVAIR